MTNSRTLARLGAVALTFACAACGTTHPHAVSDPFVTPADPGAAEHVHVDLGDRPASARPVPLRTNSPPLPASVPVDRAPHVAEAARPTTDESPFEIRPVSHVSPASHAFADVTTVQRNESSRVVTAKFTPAEPRVDTNHDPSAQFCPPPCPPPYGPPGAYPVGPTGPYPGGPAAGVTLLNGLDHPLATSADLYPDEYLCDGGDRELPVHYDVFNRLGLDTEDTVAEYLDENGKRFTKPTNRVCVYAPRFGAVRTIDMAGLEELVLEPGTNRNRQVGVGVNTRLLVATHAANDTGVALRTRSRVSGIDADVARGEVGQVARVAVHDKLINLYQNIDFLRTGILESEQRPLLAKRMQAAVAWEGDVAPFAHARIEGVHETVSVSDPQVFVGLDEGATQPAKLRIVKLADKDDAHPGEEVTFTIRYDNLGDAPVHYLKIVDNLTPRLEYVEDSADSDRVGRLVVQDNGEGSLVLIFEVHEPVEGHEGGVVSFKTRVR